MQEELERRREWLEQYLLANRRIDENGCWLWTRPCFAQTGYGMVDIWMPERPQPRVKRGAHQMAAFLWMGHNVDSGLCVCHSCDIPPCFNPDHLFIGTQNDNMQDKVRKSRHRWHRGEQSKGAKLTESQVIAIRGLLAEGTLSQREIGARYGVSRTAVASIATRRNWAHI